jgi:hypothetical protein
MQSPYPETPEDMAATNCSTLTRETRWALTHFPNADGGTDPFWLHFVHSESVNMPGSRVQATNFYKHVISQRTATAFDVWMYNSLVFAVDSLVPFKAKLRESPCAPFRSSHFPPPHPMLRATPACGLGLLASRTSMACAHDVRACGELRRRCTRVLARVVVRAAVSMSFVERTLPHVSSHACALWVSFPGTIYTLQLLGESGCSGAPVFDACSSEQADEQAAEQAERPADERALQPMDIAEVNVVAEPQTARLEK